jgi:hypothetical protein
MAGERIDVTDGPARGEQSEFERELVIGRSTEGFGALNGDPEISRRHAQISRTDEGRLYISDLGSTNGTFVNGRKIEGSAWLEPGDVVKVGQSTLKVGGGAADAGATRIGQSPTSAPTRAGTTPGAAAAGAAAEGAAAASDAPSDAPAAPPSGAPSPPPSGAPAGGPSAPSPPRAPSPPPVPTPPPAPGPAPAAAPGPGAPPPPGAPVPGPGAPPPSGGGGRRVGLIIVGAVVALLVIVGVVLAATGTFSSESKKPKPPPLTVPSTPTTPSVPTETTPTTTTENAAGKATYIIQFDRIQRSYSKQVSRLIKKARHPNSVEDIITAFKKLKTLYGSTATRIGDLDTPDEIRPVSRTYTATLRVSSAGINLIIACARARSESCYKRRLNSLSSRTRRIRKKFSRAFRARGYPVAVLAPS